jgi:hypothetical protein
MGLDACVYCDCLEKNRLREPLPKDVIIKVDGDGCPIIIESGEEIGSDHPKYDHFACEHELKHLVSHRIGNIALVGLLRAELKRDEASFPILLKKVVYNGVHAGDFLAVDQIPALRIELQRLTEFKCIGGSPKYFLQHMLAKFFRLALFEHISAKKADVFMRNFRLQMTELADAAERVRKPICF